MLRPSACGGATGIRATIWLGCLFALLATALPVPALAVQLEPPVPPTDPPPDAVAPDPEEAARLQAEREEAARQEALLREEERRTRLAQALDAARAELSASEAGLVSALGRANRARGDLVVARYDLEDARKRLADTEARIRRAERELRRSTARLEGIREDLAAEAVAAYQAGSTSQTPAMVALEAVVRSRNPRQFVAGLGYLNAMLGARVSQFEEAQETVDRLTEGAKAREVARQRAEEALALAEETHTAAASEAPREEGRLAAALAAHLERVGELVGFASAQRATAEATDAGTVTADNVQLASRIAEVARQSATTAERLRTGSDRIAAGKDGLPPWREFRCPVDGTVQFVNDWGFPRTGSRSHEGTDVFAERGTPIVAMADGVVQRVSRQDVGLGGLSVTYVVDGHRIYNAHLDTVSDGLEVGDEVRAGQRIGTVGTSGNARGTPPHNHVGMYTADDAPMNPYPILRRACR
ncbi:MAG TPA: peptidoglycan DD-metalloendopeptidase family protein [Egibacteraceae bacterium]|jgi:murein DD-endopeptidase MepM/ murein hydrolase activator NlpD|nr:peptidoglycan DD-metalloendopeptidase family protein [Egibacteraceae bacterium]